jgi:hypothetical protein
MHTAETLTIEPSFFDVETSIIRLKRYKPRGADQILAEVIEERGNILTFKKNCYSSGRKLILPIYKNGDKTDCGNCIGISLFPSTCKMLSNILFSMSTPHTHKIIGNHCF